MKAKKRIHSIGTNAEKIGNTVVSGEGFNVAIEDDSKNVAVRDYVTSKGYGGLVHWDGENPSVAGVRITPTEIKNGVSYGSRDELDEIITGVERSAGIKDAADMRDRKYKKAEDDAFKAIADRKKFSYKPENDVVYQAYKNQYERNAEKALRRVLNENNTSVTGASGAVLSDAMAAQNEELQKITDVIPELYSDAYERYISDAKMTNDTFKTINDTANEYYDRIYKSNNDIRDRIDKASVLEISERQRQIDNARNEMKDTYQRAFDDLELDIKAIELSNRDDELKADIENKRANTTKTMADTEKARADAVKVLADANKLYADADKSRADAENTRVSSEKGAMDNAISRGFFISSDESLLPWLSKYKAKDGSYTISPSMATVAYEYDKAHAREEGKIDAKLGR